MFRTRHANVYANDTGMVLGHLFTDGELVCTDCLDYKEPVFGPWLHALHEDGVFLAYDVSKQHH